MGKGNALAHPCCFVPVQARWGAAGGYGSCPTLTDYGGGTATMAGTPGDSDVGQHPVVLRVTDRAGAFVEQEFVITVAERPRYHLYFPLLFRNWQL